MSTKNLSSLFRPESVAVIGATNKEGRIGNLVMNNLLEGGFDGPIMPVNPKRQAVVGVLAYPDIDALPVVPDLAIICTPPAPIPGLIATLGKRGTSAAIVLTAGLQRTETDDGVTVKEAMLAEARKSGLRILGPNCLGLIVPGIRLNASFAHAQAHPGKIAFASQSGAMCTAVLDWAREHEIGFPHFVSLGDCADVDFGDTVDFLATDPGTTAILLYIEAVQDGRKFMSACRAAARNKPVVVIKSGRVAEGAEAAASHTGALAGSDNVYDSAIRRAGMLRVDDIDELFAAVETLARAKRMRGERLAVMTNGGGIGVMAVDRLITEGGTFGRIVARDDQPTRRGPARDLVTGQSRRHHRRCSRPAVFGRSRYSGCGERSRRRPRYACADGNGVEHRSGGRCDRSRTWPESQYSDQLGRRRSGRSGPQAVSRRRATHLRYTGTGGRRVHAHDRLSA